MVTFDRQLMGNIDFALDREILSTNMAGAYSATTIIDCNTRKYHGLLVVPTNDDKSGNYVLLSSLDETIVQHGAEFNLSAHVYKDNSISPKGYTYIRRFEFDNPVRTIYRVGGIIFQKERLLVLGENRYLVRYTLLEGHSSVVLRLRPFLAYRNVHKLTQQNSFADTEGTVIENGVRYCLYDHLPDLYMQTNLKNEWKEEPYWYKDIHYQKEQVRGCEANEDLFTPGVFELTMKKGQSVIFSSGVEPISPRRLSTLFEKEVALHAKRDNSLNILRAAAKQYMFKHDGQAYLLAGYPWFGCDARSEFISLPGVTACGDNKADFEALMTTAKRAIESVIMTGSHDTRLQGLTDADSMLWAVWAIQQYALRQGVEVAIKQWGGLVCDIVDYIRRQNHPSLFLHNNGLVYNNALFEAPFPFTRHGYVVEINALWYNALKFAAEINRYISREGLAQMLENQAQLTQQSFVNTFWNGSYLYDFVVGDHKSDYLRPCQIIAVSLPYSPLTKQMQKSIVDLVTRELLTPKGLRSLTPKSTRYAPFYSGNHITRDHTVYNGPVYPWMTASYVEAYLKIYQRSGVAFVERALSALESELKDLTLGCLSEYYDGNPPYRGHGAMSYAPSVAETLRAIEIIKRIKNK